MSGNKATRQCQAWFKGSHWQDAIWAADKRKLLSSLSSRWASSDGIIAACSFWPPTALYCSVTHWWGLWRSLIHPTWNLLALVRHHWPFLLSSCISHSELIKRKCYQYKRKQTTSSQFQRQCAHEELPWPQTFKISVKSHWGNVLFP